MELRFLIHDLDLEEIVGNDSIEVKGISKDSREIKDGYLFFMTKNNRIYLEDAKKRGARIVVTDISEPISAPCVVRVKDITSAMGKIASRFYGEPSKYLFVTGITGTNGKTTTAFLIDWILKSAKKSSGLISTIHYRYEGCVLEAKNTTPGSIELQRLLKDMKDSGTTHVTMEVSSHALDQKRVEGLDFDLCIFTNLSHDHLDYHGSFSAYRDAKISLFGYHLRFSSKPKKISILNRDDPNFPYFFFPDIEATYFYGMNGNCHANVGSYSQTVEGTEIELLLLGEKIKIRSNLIGDFNLYNIMAASLATKIMGIETTYIKKGLETFPGVPGRLEKMKNNLGYHIFVDYAHTPDALEKVLKALSSLKKGKLFVVFGCGGNRDREKRPIMGKIATSNADFSIITSDNPRDENPEEIIKEIVGGISSSNYKIILDRKEAIYEALRLMKPDDILLVAGKGHEEYQIIGDKLIPFSDRKVIEEAFRVAF